MSGVIFISLVYKREIIPRSLRPYSRTTGTKSLSVLNTGHSCVQKECVRLCTERMTSMKKLTDGIHTCSSSRALCGMMLI